MNGHRQYINILMYQKEKLYYLHRDKSPKFMPSFRRPSSGLDWTLCWPFSGNQVLCLTHQQRKPSLFSRSYLIGNGIINAYPQDKDNGATQSQPFTQPLFKVRIESGFPLQAQFVQHGGHVTVTVLIKSNTYPVVTIFTSFRFQRPISDLCIKLPR